MPQVLAFLESVPPNWPIKVSNKTHVKDFINPEKKVKMPLQFPKFPTTGVLTYYLHYHASGQTH